MELPTKIDQPSPQPEGNSQDPNLNPAPLERQDLCSARLNPRVLLIDNDGPFCTEMEKSARDAGVNLTSCGSLDEFGRLPSHRHFDVIILNYYQGELTGAHVASVLGDKPILLISETLPPDIEAWRGDVRNFLPKSSGPETLLATALFLVSSPEMESPAPDPVQADKVRRDQILGTIQRLIKEDDPEFIREVVDLFLAQSAGLILSIHVALGKRISADVLRLVQELRANSANVGAQSLARWCALLEDRSRDEKWERCLLLAKGLNAEFRRVKELLERPA